MMGSIESTISKWRIGLSLDAFTRTGRLISVDVPQVARRAWSKHESDPDKVRHGLILVLYLRRRRAGSE